MWVEVSIKVFHSVESIILPVCSACVNVSLNKNKEAERRTYRKIERKSALKTT